MLAASEAPRADARISSLAPIETNAPPFELRAGPHEFPALVVLSFRGREAISRPFSFEITVAASLDVDGATIEPDLLGRPACLTMQAGASGARLVRGVVASVAALSLAHGGRSIYRLRIVPALWLLKKRTTSRIFQDKTVPEIVAAVLDEAGIAYALRLIGKYRPRTYCVQHRETDLAFVERLLAEEGIFYTFDHGGADAKTETVALSDSVRLYPAIEGDSVLAYRPHEGAVGMSLGEHHVQSFAFARSLRPTSVFRRGYDFRRPGLALEAEAKLAEMGGGEPARGDVYEHHEEDEEPNIRPETVAAELEQHRARIELGRGESGCRRLVPGSRFTLCDHDLGRLDREYVVTEIKHTGCSPDVATPGQAVYANTFECVPATIAARPSRPTRALQQVTETAIVVGPEAQEIYTDEYGRVKVQFHWDREGRRDEHSSCWIRVTQAWAGSGWGFEFIPRVGMEVVVTFLGGDVDRPLITGCVPNALNKPPFKLPEDRTRSGIRTHSTPGGHGYNELSFEDRKGAELVHLRAERNLDEKVVHDQITVVGHNKTLAVGASLDEKIELDHATTVVGDRRETILGTAGFSCAGGRSTTTAKNDVRQVGGNDIAIVAGDVVRQVMGNVTDSVQRNVTVSVNGHHDLHIGTHELLKHGSVFASGNYRIIAGREAVVLAERSITFTCGESEITLSPEGITLKGKIIALEGGAISAKSGGAEVRIGDTAEIISDKIHLQAKEAAIDLELEAKIDGNLVKLNCGPERVKVGTNGEEVPNHAVIQVVQHMADEPFERMKVTVANAKGETREYISGEDGTIRVAFGPDEKPGALRIVSMAHADDDRVVHLSDVGRS